MADHTVDESVPGKVVGLCLHRDGTLRIQKTDIAVQRVAHSDLHAPLDALTRLWVEQAGQLLGFEPSKDLTHSRSRLQTRVRALANLIGSLRFPDAEDPPGGE